MSWLKVWTVSFWIAAQDAKICQSLRLVVSICSCFERFARVGRSVSALDLHATQQLAEVSTWEVGMPSIFAAAALQLCTLASLPLQCLCALMVLHVACMRSKE